MHFSVFHQIILFSPSWNIYYYVDSPPFHIILNQNYKLLLKLRLHPYLPFFTFSNWYTIKWKAKNTTQWTPFRIPVIHLIVGTKRIFWLGKREMMDLVRQSSLTLPIHYSSWPATTCLERERSITSPHYMGHWLTSRTNGYEEKV